jgi:hypothetical protein
MVRARSQGPEFLPALYTLGFTVLMVLLAIGTAQHHVWALTVIFANRVAHFRLLHLYLGSRVYPQARRRQSSAGGPAGRVNILVW